jgi:ribose transport system substrate-binding protein
MRRLVLGLLAVVMGLSLTSCAKKEAATTAPSGPAQVRIAFVTNNVSDFWSIAKAGVQAGEKDFNAVCDFKMPTTGTALEQKEILQDLATKGTRGVAISPVNPDSQTEVLNQAAGKMSLICMDSDAPKSKRLCYVGTSNYAAGKAAGGQLVKALPNGGTVMIYVGTLDAQNAAERNKGVADAVKGTRIKILGTMTDNADHTKARANVEDTLVKHPDIGALVGLWSYNGPAIADAVKSGGKVGKVKIVCFDEDAKTLAAVKDGTIFATVVQKPYKFGYESVRVLAAMARGEKLAIPANKIFDQGVDVINKTNVDQFWTNLKKMTGKE